MYNKILKYARGTVWKTDLTGIEDEQGVQSGYRPVLIVSNDYGNLTSKSVMVASITSNEERAKYPINVKFRNENDEYNVVLCNQVRTISVKKLERYEGILSDDTMLEVDTAMKLALGIKSTNESLEKLEKTVNNIIDGYKNIDCKSKDTDITTEQINTIASKLEEMFKGVVIPLDRAAKAAPVLTAYCEAAEKPEEIAPKKENKKEKKVVENKTDKPKKARKPHGFWTTERKRELLNDKDNMSMQEIRDKWGIDKPKSLYQMCYLFRGELNETGETTK